MCTVPCTGSDNNLPSIGAWLPSGLAAQLEGGDRSREAGGARPRGRLQGRQAASRDRPYNSPGFSGML
jgi:hypothetical protein